MQCGSQDCGLFAIAFATVLCLGKLCFIESQEMTIFPVKRVSEEKETNWLPIDSYLKASSHIQF